MCGVTGICGSWSSSDALAGGPGNPSRRSAHGCDSAARFQEHHQSGARLRCFGVRIQPRSIHGATTETYGDHRTAMSLTLVGLRVPGVVIRNPRCSEKTYPRFFEDLQALRGN